MAKRPGLYANIHAKRKRIKAGSKEKMRKKGQKGRPTKANFILTVSLGFSSVYNLLPLPFGFLPVPFLGSGLFFATFLFPL